MEFHISRNARKRYQFEESLFAFNGNVIFANFHSARIFAQRMNERHDLISHPELAVQAGQINAMGLIDEILHLVISLFRTRKNPAFYQDLQEMLGKQLGTRKFNTILRAFTRDFPPPAVFQGKQIIDEYLESEVDGIPNQCSAVEELFMLWLANQNPAYLPYNELFNDSDLAEKTAYPELVAAIKDFFLTQPTFGPDNQNLVDMLRSPAIAVPDSLRGQLEYIRTRWADLLGHYLLKLLGSLNLFSEEEHFRGLGPGPVRVPVYGTFGEAESEHFSLDADWMPNLVLMAKNIYVWLDQLSKKYQQSITRLDQIPDEELEQLAQWGFTGLWLIGLWERSRASARIKQLCGNPEAIASAYSLKEYCVAEELGGEEALANLRSRCWRRSIRLASDMVPNHMAIDSNWIHEHPDWFISLPYSPFPSYSFSGPNLSNDPHAEIQIEDHFYDRTDAAVVFKFHDNRYGNTRYIYHGNDGTSMPWNDTAQLNYLDVNVREAVIRTILDVARRFPIIRFDAAMTLAKRHYQRLWYPLPGGGCDIPSRSEFGMSQENFNLYFPQEFWREVVDRVAEEAPDTLLLAEAFWLMEGYFVRTLGMHRVYNSAFMNLLRDEDNAKYRQVMKNTLEFDPEILKRFVNFMNNPDEHTAANQFGKGDKYFGICTMMATMPGLPMFGHGQVEGLTEKYGMEYRRAYWDEMPDQQLIERHIWQIFPLLRHRYLFANVDQFFLYDFFTDEGGVDENVFAFSNRFLDERTLVVYHNRFDDTAGWIRTSVGFMDKKIGVIRQVDLWQGLGIPDKKEFFVIFRDQITGMEYIRNCREIAGKGFFIQLDAYKAHVFMDFVIVEDDENSRWRRVHDYLNGRGTEDIRSLQWELPLRPVLQPLREVANSGYFNFLLAQKPRVHGEAPPDFLLNEADHKLGNLMGGAAALLGLSLNIIKPCKSFKKIIKVLYQFEWLDQQWENPVPAPVIEISDWLRERSNPEIWLAQVCWVFLDCLRNALQIPVERFFSLAKEWRFFAILESALWDTGSMVGFPGEITRSIEFLLQMDGWLGKSSRHKTESLCKTWLRGDFFREYLRVNEYGGKTWIGKESLDTALALMTFEGVIEITEKYRLGTGKALDRLGRLSEIILKFRDLSGKAGYDLNRLLKLLS